MCLGVGKGHVGLFDGTNHRAVRRQEQIAFKLIKKIRYINYSNFTKHVILNNREDRVVPP